MFTVLIALAISASPAAAQGCWLTAAGYFLSADGIDSFGGNTMPKKNSTILGQWQHTDHGTGGLLAGQMTYLVCRYVSEPRPSVPAGAVNQVYFGGPARWFALAEGWQDGFWFDVVVEDHGEPGVAASAPDEYFLTVRAGVDIGSGNAGSIVYSTGGTLSGGNIQIQAPSTGHPFVASLLPPWVTFVP